MPQAVQLSGQAIQGFATAVGTAAADATTGLDGVFNQTMLALSTNAVAFGGFVWRGRLAINAGVHTLTVRGVVDAGTGTIKAGTGATGLNPNAVLVVKPS